MVKPNTFLSVVVKLQEIASVFIGADEGLAILNAKMAKTAGGFRISPKPL